MKIVREARGRQGTFGDHSRNSSSSLLDKNLGAFTWDNVGRILGTGHPVDLWRVVGGTLHRIAKSDPVDPVVVQLRQSAVASNTNGESH